MASLMLSGDLTWCVTSGLGGLGLTIRNFKTEGWKPLSSAIALHLIFHSAAFTCKIVSQPFAWLILLTCSSFPIFFISNIFLRKPPFSLFKLTFSLYASAFTLALFCVYVVAGTSGAFVACVINYFFSLICLIASIISSSKDFPHKDKNHFFIILISLTFGLIDFSLILTGNDTSYLISRIFNAIFYLPSLIRFALFIDEPHPTIAGKILAHLGLNCDFDENKEADILVAPRRLVPSFSSFFQPAVFWFLTILILASGSIWGPSVCNDRLEPDEHSVFYGWRLFLMIFTSIQLLGLFVLSLPNGSCCFQQISFNFSEDERLPELMKHSQELLQYMFAPFGIIGFVVHLIMILTRIEWKMNIGNPQKLIHCTFGQLLLVYFIWHWIHTRVKYGLREFFYFFFACWMVVVMLTRIYFNRFDLESDYFDLPDSCPRQTYKTTLDVILVGASFFSFLALHNAFRDLMGIKLTGIMVEWNEEPPKRDPELFRRTQPLTAVKNAEMTFDLIPEAFLGYYLRSILIAMTFCAALTLVFSELNYNENLIHDMFGVNSICLMFDYAPSTYFGPFFYAISMAVAQIYLLTYFFRISLMYKAGCISKRIYNLNQLLLISEFFSYAYFGTVFSISQENVGLHVFSYCQLIFVMCISHLKNVWYMENFSVMTDFKKRAYEIWVAIFAIFGIWYAVGMLAYVYVGDYHYGRRVTGQESGLIMIKLVDGIFTLLFFSQALFGSYVNDDFHFLRVNLQLIKGKADNENEQDFGKVNIEMRGFADSENSTKEWDTSSIKVAGISTSVDQATDDNLIEVSRGYSETDSLSSLSKVEEYSISMDDMNVGDVTSILDTRTPQKMKEDKIGSHI